MADSMILNIDLDNLPPIAPRVTFKGGQWRDRKKAQRDYKRKQQIEDGPAGAEEGKPGTKASNDRPVKRARVEGEGGGGRPGQQRWQPSSSANGATTTTTAPTTTATTRPPPAVPAGRPQNGVTSRLFTSNPAPVTDFDDDAPAKDDDAAPVRPSNAPLSDEAATFLALGLSRRIARQLSEFMALKAPTAIQKNAITQLLAHDHDAFLQAETGSGKTLAYLLPIVQRLLALSEANDGTRRPFRLSRGLGLFAVVLAPTRELCTQIAAVLDKLLGCAPWLHATTVVGGENKKAEKARLRKGANILVATPGRLTDHLHNTDVLDVSQVRWLVLDEGDRLMEMGFEKDIRAIVGKIREGAAGPGGALDAKSKDGQVLPEGVLPARRVTVLCSATMKMNAIKLGEITLEDAVHIKASSSPAGVAGGDNNNTKTAAADDVAPGAAKPVEDAGSGFAAPSQLKQTYAIVPAKLRLVTLIALLRATFARKDAVMKAIVFLSCADAVDFHFALLRLFGDDGLPVVQASTATEEGEGDSDSESPPKSPSKAPSPNTASTVAPAAYITSPANRTVLLHKLHGSLEQPVRKATLASFCSAAHPALLITTDIAARGLDVPAVDLVIEYDPAMAVEDHLHRIGRTARAGRAGNTTLFLLPGSEEGYVAFLKESSASSSSPPSVFTPQLYDALLKKGYAAPVALPPSFTAAGEGEGRYSAVPAEHDPSQPQQSWTKRAEALQLHVEQRLLRSAADAAGVDSANGIGGGGGGGWSAHNKGKKDNKKDKKKDKSQAKAGTTSLLDEARQAFRSHIRAYATHTHAERVYFDMTRLHLGHMAKSFGLREAPGHMGGSVQRLTAKKPAGRAAASRQKSGGGTTVSSSARRTSGGGSAGRYNDADDDSDDDRGRAGAGAGAADEDATRRMQQKMREMMSNPAAEFNIG